MTSWTVPSWIIVASKLGPASESPSSSNGEETVDLASVPTATVGSAVELWGAFVPVDEVAQAAGTVGYELLCAVAPRVPFTVVD